VKICLICVEVFAWGKFGGFGRSTRLLGAELRRRGFDVCAIVPRRADQKPVEQLDGMTVYGFPMTWPFAMAPLLRACDADVYHSQHPSLGTYLAMRAAPRKRHVVTFRDPKDRSDWWLELTNATSGKARVVLNRAYEDNPAIRWAIRRLDGRFCAAAFLNDKLERIYGFDAPLDTLPTPIEVPAEIEKSATPLVAFVGRLDRRKRPERFFELCARFPHVQFVAAGASHDKAWGKELRDKFGGQRNLTMLGFVDQFRSSQLFDLLGKSWVLVNTAVREGLPTSFLEAMARRCAILSHVNPDDIAARFGYHARDDDFVAGLSWLLENDRWRERGRAAVEYVRSGFELEQSVEKHVSVYERLAGSAENHRRR
jgi:glycosyltransferase involved in cell wall biosynthesis